MNLSIKKIRSSYPIHTRLLWTTDHTDHSLNPLGAIIANIFENASGFTQTVSSRRTRRTTLPTIGITKDGCVVNVKVGLSRVGIESIPHGTSIVANQFAVFAADGKARLVAFAKIVFAIFAHVLVKEFVKDALGKLGRWFGDS